MASLPVGGGANLEVATDRLDLNKCGLVGLDRVACEATLASLKLAKEMACDRDEGCKAKTFALNSNMRPIMKHLTRKTTTTLSYDFGQLQMSFDMLP